MKVPSWETIPEELLAMLEKEYAAGPVYPPKDLVFQAFKETPPEKVKVVILGQDPYPTEYKARGVAFGYNFEYPGNVNSSLANIIKEVRRDTGRFSQVMVQYIEDIDFENSSITVSTDYEDDTSLESWTEQGVLLLNTRLTVRAGKPMSHAKMGWEGVVTNFLQELDKEVHGKVYLLWGKEAQKYKKYINTEANLVLETSHPCRFSAHRGFKGCGHFSKANEYLRKLGKKEIEW